MTSPNALQQTLDAILAAGKAQGMHAKDLAIRVGTTPETLSRMRRRGRGDFELVDRMARLVGLRVGLMPDDDRLAAIQRGEFF